MQLSRFVIAGTHSGVGKTSIATGVMAALTQRGYAVQGFKVGPDYIDPGYHSMATGRKSRNLDTFLFPAKHLRAMFCLQAGSADISVVEGVMGLYDGSRGGKASTAEIAKILQAPVILVVDARSMAASAAAIVLGFQQLDPKVNLVGVILNRVGSKRHEEMLRNAIDTHTGVEILGVIGRDKLPSLAERHLGLLPSPENKEIKQNINQLAEAVTESVDLNRLLALAADVPKLQASSAPLPGTSAAQQQIPVGLALDEAFNFYYQDGLDYLQQLGAKLVPFSPLRSNKIPNDIKGLILGGGFPEIFLHQLSGNQSLMRDIRERVTAGLPCYAECGGLMYLSQGITDLQGSSIKSLSVITGKCIMGTRLAGMGYRELTLSADCLLGRKGEVLRGHEFHYSTMQWQAADNNPFVEQSVDGFAADNVFASYLHLHWLGNPAAALSFLKHCSAYS